MEKHNVDEYDSGLSFCYDCIMFVLKTEYPELDIKKLEASVNAYMNEQNNDGGETGGPPKATVDAAPSCDRESQGANVDPPLKTH